ncbi:MAG: arginase family protein [Clostridia bacterium]|nr:arginase family protein [Clostridia bacterium]
MWRDLLAGNFKDADIAVFGIAVDENCSVGRGTASAPMVLRECSEYLPPYTATGERLKPVLWDLGDVREFHYGQVFEKMSICKDKKCVLMIGGDHSCSILSERAFRALHDGKIGLIHIDAHADICDVYMGSKYSHACVNRRALENGYAVEDISLVGIRSFEEQEKEYLAEHPVFLLRADEIFCKKADKVVDELCQKYTGYDGIYLSFDIDAVDPAYAPGTGTPEPFGLSNLTVLTILKGLVERLPVKALDVVEVSPPLDVNNITAWLALKYILEIIKIIDKK